MIRHGFTAPRALAAVLLTAGILTAGMLAVPGTSAALTPSALHSGGCPAAESPPGFDDAVPSDFDGDGNADDLVGGNNGIDLRYSTNAGVHIASALASAVDYGTFNSDQCADLVVGDALDNEVDVYFGPVSVNDTPDLSLTPPDAHQGDRFGAAVATAYHYDSGGFLVLDLWVGAPGTTVDGQAGAGTVYHYMAEPGDTPALVQEFTEHLAAVPGGAGRGDNFGGVLSPTAGGVAIGMPAKSVGGHAKAGQVDVLAIDTAGKLSAARAYTQGTAGVGGAVAAGHEFGASVAGGGAVVGTPNDTVAGHKDAGSIEYFTHGKDVSALTPKRYLTENSPGVPGGAEAGDRFGASVSIGTFQCQEGTHVAAGAPGESIGSIVGAGSVTLIPVFTNDSSDCKDVLLYPGHDLPGTPTAKAGFGQHLGIRPANPFFDEDAEDGLLVGAPAAGSGGSGAVYSWSFGVGGSLTETGGPLRHSAYGLFFAPS